LRPSILESVLALAGDSTITRFLAIIYFAPISN
jgi:hypothetical protein